MCVPVCNVTNYCCDSPHYLHINLGRGVVFCVSCWLKIGCYWSFPLHSHRVTKTLCWACAFSHGETNNCPMQMHFFCHCFTQQSHLYWDICLSVHLLELRVLTLMSHRVWGYSGGHCTGKRQVLLEHHTWCYYAAFLIENFCSLFITQKAWPQSNRPVLTRSTVAVAEPFGASENIEGSDQVSKAHVHIPAVTGFLAQAM